MLLERCWLHIAFSSKAIYRSFIQPHDVCLSQRLLSDLTGVKVGDNIAVSCSVDVMYAGLSGFLAEVMLQILLD